jgi:hypothetical protein
VYGQCILEQIENCGADVARGDLAPRSEPKDTDFGMSRWPSSDDGRYAEKRPVEVGHRPEQSGHRFRPGHKAAVLCVQVNSDDPPPQIVGVAGKPEMEALNDYEALYTPRRHGRDDVRGARLDSVRVAETTQRGQHGLGTDQGLVHGVGIEGIPLDDRQQWVLTTYGSRVPCEQCHLVASIQGHRQ